MLTFGRAQPELVGPSHAANSARSTRDVRSLNRRASSAGESLGRTLTKMCTWSGITSLAAISQALSKAISSSSSFNRAATRPTKSRRRYFGHHTTCKPSELTPPAERRKRVEDMTGSEYESAVTLTGGVGPAARALTRLTAEAASPPLGSI
jgi:hypothetical protein